MYRNFLRMLQVCLAVSFIFILGSGCSSICADQILSAEQIEPDNNVLRHKLKIETKENTDLFVRYWQKDNKDSIFSTAVSKNKTTHHPVLIHLKPAHSYEYELVIEKDNCQWTSPVANFTTKEIPLGLMDMAVLAESEEASIPDKFKNGFVLTARRDLPGYMFIVNVKGEIVWYQQVNESGFKVAHFTKEGTLLSILAPLSFPTSYGNEILEMNLEGDTIFTLKKGEKGFDKTIHHEMIKNNSGHYVTITLEERIFDLREVGGNEQDTVTGDGILVLDKEGNKVWEWTVFDVLDPKSDSNILKDKSDWLHANSLSIDNDGNYILSFYLSGQVWKIDSKTGKLIWKMGRGGDFIFPKGGEFFESHAVHRTDKNDLMLFENGTDKRRSRVLEYTIDETKHTATLNMEMDLPGNLYTQRMGSVYWIDNTHLLVCSSQERAIVLTDKAGNILWRLRAGFIPYRAEFIDKASFFRQPTNN